MRWIRVLAVVVAVVSSPRVSEASRLLVCIPTLQSLALAQNAAAPDPPLVGQLLKLANSPDAISIRLNAVDTLRLMGSSIKSLDTDLVRRLLRTKAQHDADVAAVAAAQSELTKAENTLAVVKEQEPATQDSPTLTNAKQKAKTAKELVKQREKEYRTAQDNLAKAEAGGPPQVNPAVPAKGKAAPKANGKVVNAAPPDPKAILKQAVENAKKALQASRIDEKAAVDALKQASDAEPKTEVSEALKKAQDSRDAAKKKLDDIQAGVTPDNLKDEDRIPMQLKVAAMLAAVGAPAQPLVPDLLKVSGQRSDLDIAVAKSVEAIVAPPKAATDQAKKEVSAAASPAPVPNVILTNGSALIWPGAAPGSVTKTNEAAGSGATNPGKADSSGK